MSEWIVAGIVVSVIGSGWGVVKAVSGIVKPLTEQITTLNLCMKHIVENMQDLTNRNSKSHERFFDELEKQSASIDNHEIRLVRLEEHEKR